MVTGNIPDGLRCVLCSFPARDALQHSNYNCGKVFCTSCWEDYKHRNTFLLCPSCKQPSDNIVKDARTDREVRALQVYCNNKKEGCTWIGDLSHLDSHLRTCPYHTVPCNQLCGAQVKRSQLEDHHTKQCPRRQHKCKHCQEIGEYRRITSAEHLDSCPSLPIPCTIHGCKRKVKRSEMPSHREVCIQELVNCQYHSIGCRARIKRGEVPSHNLEFMNSHLELAVEAIGRQRAEFAQQIEGLNRIIHSMGSLTSVTFKMQDVKKLRRARVRNTWYSPEFYTHSTMGYKARLRVNLQGCGEGKGTHVSCFICLTPGEHDAHLDWPFRGSFTITLLNQQEKGLGDHSIQVTFLAEAEASQRPTTNSNGGLGYNTFISQKKLDEHTQYLKDDCLLFRVTVDRVDSKIKPEMACITST